MYVYKFECAWLWTRWLHERVCVIGELLQVNVGLNLDREAK